MNELKKDCKPEARQSIKKHDFLDLNSKKSDRSGVRMILEKIIIHMICSEIKSCIENFSEILLM